MNKYLINFKSLTILAMLTFSTGLSANNKNNIKANSIEVLSVELLEANDNEGTKNLTTAVEKQFPYVYIRNKKHELKYYLKDYGSFILLIIEVESNFFGNNPEYLQVKQAVAPISDQITKKLIDTFQKPVRLVINYKDKKMF